MAGEELPLEVGAVALCALWSCIPLPSAFAPPCPFPSLDPPYPQVLLQSAQTSARQLLAALDYERSLSLSYLPPARRPELPSWLAPGIRDSNCRSGHAVCLPVARPPLALPRGLSVCPRRAARPPRAARLGETRPPRTILANTTPLNGTFKRCTGSFSPTHTPLLILRPAFSAQGTIRLISFRQRSQHNSNAPLPLWLQLCAPVRSLACPHAVLSASARAGSSHQGSGQQIKNILNPARCDY